MKKRWIVLVAVLMAFSLVMAACGGGIETPPPAATPETPAATTPEPEAPAYTGEVVELTMMNHEGPQSPTAEMLDVWCDAVKAASGGSLIVTPFHGSLGGPRDTYGMITDGAVDMGFGLSSFYPGVFPVSDGVALPFIGAKNSIQAAHAWQEFYDTTEYLKPEYSDVHVLVIYTNTVSPVITADKKIEKVEDLRGMNIRTIGGPITEFMKLAQANPMTIDLGEIYTSFEKGVINAIAAVGWEAVEATAVYELGNYFFDWEMQVNPTWILMNLDKWNSLSDEHKAVLDSVSGHAGIDIQGDIREQARQRMYTQVGKQGGEVYQLSEADMAPFVAMGEQARQPWRDSVDALGYDALGIENQLIDLFAKYAKEYPMTFTK